MTSPRLTQSTEDLLTRLAEDRAELAALLGHSPGDVAAIVPGAAAHESQAPYAAIVRFTSGTEVLYRASGADADRSFRALVHWVNRQAVGPALEMRPLLDRGTHCWVIRPKAQPPRSVEESRRYYRRAGMLLCLLYATRATQVRGDDPVARGEHLLLTPHFGSSVGAASPGAVTTVKRHLLAPLEFDRDSVIETEFLCEWPDPTCHEGGERILPVGGAPEEPARILWVGGTGGGEPAMHSQCETADREDPSRDAIAQSELVVEGFRRVYRLLLEHRAELAGVSGARDPDPGRADSAATPVRDAAVSFHPRLRDGFTRMSEEDLGTQCALVRDAIRLHATARQARSRFDVVPAEELARVEPAEKAAWLDFALQFAAELRDRAIPLQGGGVGWLKLGARGAGRRRLQPLGLRLSDGQVGLAFFLAALGHATGRADYRDLARAALLPLRQRIAAWRDDEAPDALGLGACTGLGSAIYALVRCAGWLCEPALLGDARRLAALATSERVSRDEALDVMDGAAGLLLALLALDRADPAAGALDLAHLCAERLLQARTVSSTGLRAWATGPRRRLLTGFGHGAAGIAYALARMAAASGNGVFAEAAREGMAYERTQFLPAQRTWADLRFDSRGRAPTNEGWCVGAPGIALARIGVLDVVDDAAIRGDIDLALDVIRRADVTPHHHLCCGTMAVVEAQLTAARRLMRPDLEAEAQRRATLAIRQLSLVGERLRACGGTPMYVDLFEGRAGIAYECLRLAQPDRLSVLLLFE
ncbi:MAG TPA: lanthionine synthetase LanC family protein [Longimicrobiales bacterium]